MVEEGKVPQGSVSRGPSQTAMRSKLLTHKGSILLDSAQPICPRSLLRMDMSPEALIKIWDVGPIFKEMFLSDDGEIQTTAGGRTLNFDDFRLPISRTKDTCVLTSIFGLKDLVIWPTEFCRLLRLQSMGQSGGLHVDNQMNVCFMYDVDNEVRPVSFTWTSRRGGWIIDSSGSGFADWVAGTRLVTAAPDQSV